MKAKHVVGKRIVAIGQERVSGESVSNVFDLEYLLLEDGSKIVLSVCELGHDYAVEGTVYDDEGNRKR